MWIEIFPDDTDFDFLPFSGWLSNPSLRFLIWFLVLSFLGVHETRGCGWFSTVGDRGFSLVFLAKNKRLPATTSDCYFWLVFVFFNWSLRFMRWTLQTPHLSLAQPLDQVPIGCGPDHLGMGTKLILYRHLKRFHGIGFYLLDINHKIIKNLS